MEGYIKQNDRKKILLLSDDLRLPSGVGTMSKEIVLGTAHHYNWVQLGAAINHSEAGKRVDMSQWVNETTGINDASVTIYPSSGYGTLDTIRSLMKLEMPDAIFIFTDPRYWEWLFAAEEEIRSQVPIIYLNIWDNVPYPMWNKKFYESCDALFAISKQTRNINIQVLGDKAKDKIIRYIPHGVSMEYHPVDKDDEGLKKFISQKLQTRPKFRLLYNARNIGRKNVSNMVLAWKVFCDRIGKDKARNCELLMHTEPVSNFGTDLLATCNDLCDPDYVKIHFLNQKLDTPEMNYMYNASDGVILVSSNEGWGLSLTEALCTGKMIIATVTGGMQDQMRFEDSKGNWLDFNLKFPSNHMHHVDRHGEWAIPVWPVERSTGGSVATPYIYDDKTTITDIADAIFELYSLSPEERTERGMKGREWATSDEAGFTAVQMSKRIIEGIDATLENFIEHPRYKYELIEIKERPSTRLDYDPVNYTYEQD